MEKRRWARSSNVPPHLRPRAVRADFKRSKPSEASSSQDEKPERSNGAPVVVRALLLVVSFYNTISIKSHNFEIQKKNK